MTAEDLQPENNKSKKHTIAVFVYSYCPFIICNHQGKTQGYILDKRQTPTGSFHPVRWRHERKIQNNNPTMQIVVFLHSLYNYATFVHVALFQNTTIVFNFSRFSISKYLLFHNWIPFQWILSENKQTANHMAGSALLLWLCHVKCDYYYSFTVLRLSCPIFI